MPKFSPLMVGLRFAKLVRRAKNLWCNDTASGRRPCRSSCVRFERAFGRQRFQTRGQQCNALRKRISVSIRWYNNDDRCTRRGPSQSGCTTSASRPPSTPPKCIFDPASLLRCLSSHIIDAVAFVALLSTRPRSAPRCASARPC